MPISIVHDWETPYEVWHDLESFVYVFLWMATPNEMRANRRAAYLRRLDYRITELASAKRNLVL